MNAATPARPSARPPVGLGDRLRANGSLLTTSIVWGSFFPLVDRLLQTWDTLTLAAARLSFAALGLLTILVLREGRRAFSGPLPWRRIWFAGGFGLGGFTFFITVGIGASGAVPAAVISTSSPVIALILAWVLGRVPLRRAALIGVAFAVSGGLVVVFAPGRSFDGVRGGEIFVLLAAVAWVWQSLMSQQWLAGLSQLRIAALLSAAGALNLTVLASVLALAGVTAPVADLSPESLAILAYLALVGGSLGNFLWYFGVSRLGVTVASMYNNLIPVFAVLVALLLGTELVWTQLAGGALILAGVVWAQRGR